MARKRRIESSDGVYHLINRGNYAASNNCGRYEPAREKGCGYAKGLENMNYEY